MHAKIDIETQNDNAKKIYFWQNPIPFVTDVPNSDKYSFYSIELKQKEMHLLKFEIYKSRHWSELPGKM